MAITLEVVYVLHLESVAWGVYLWDSRCEKLLLELHTEVVLGGLPLSLLVENDPLNHFFLDLLLNFGTVQSDFPVELSLYLSQLRPDFLLLSLSLLKILFGPLDSLHSHFPLDLLSDLFTIDFFLELMLTFQTQLLHLGFFFSLVFLKQLLLNTGTHIFFQLLSALGTFLGQLCLFRLDGFTHELLDFLSFQLFFFLLQAQHTLP
jgi:hypothetical protein